MNDLELIFTMLGERVRQNFPARKSRKKCQSINQLAMRGGKVAGNARKETEKELGHSIISSENYLPKDELPNLIDETKYQKP